MRAKGEHRSALRGMNPTEAFPRLEEIMRAYFNLRLEALAIGIQSPLDSLPQLRRSDRPAVAKWADELHSQLEWLRVWFPQCTSAQLVHIADLTTRAFNRELNLDPEDQFVKLIIRDLGTVRARNILTQLETQGLSARVAKVARPTKLAVVKQGRALIRRLSQG